MENLPCKSVIDESSFKPVDLRDLLSDFASVTSSQGVRGMTGFNVKPSC